MLIREASDIHLEFTDFTFPPMPGDKDTILILAGDVGLVHNPNQRHKLSNFLERCSDQFKHVFYVVGNHEYYHNSIHRVLPDIKKLIIDNFSLMNVTLLEDSDHVVDDVAFIGSTLWTDYDGGRPESAAAAEQFMNDHQLITTKTSDGTTTKFSPAHAFETHMRSREYVFNRVKDHKASGRKTVVIVHHGVSPSSTHALYAGSPFNGAFTSNLEREIADAQPDIIFHGHTHHCFDYRLKNTRVIVNPRGYTWPGGRVENSDFDPELLIVL